MSIEKALAVTLETAAIKGANAYTWGIYKGSPLRIVSRKGTEYVLNVLRKGELFGARLSSSGREIRFVFPKQDPGLTRIYTTDSATATKVYKKSVLVQKPR